MSFRNTKEYDAPETRHLRIYSLDPALQTQMETAHINQVSVAIPWESLEIGPVGEYIEVVDYDPASGYFYKPVDLDHPYVLVQNGLPASEGDPKFHQQMVYAVAMMTINNFEHALGRRIFWSTRRYVENGKWHSEYVQRLRVYPHALREANAYYSPDKKALLFGYFPADGSDPGSNYPGGMVFTCLSHDVIAHETTHALLDGIHRRYIEVTNPDVLAFHEAFADIVALFQHFSVQEVLVHQLTKTRGDLRTDNLLGQLASQFGKAIGSRGALRDAIGKVDDEGRWQPHQPNPDEYQTTYEPHARGALLVAAIFDAFMTIYETRTEDLIRIASGGTGIRPEGRLHPDLINRLAREACKTSQHLLTMCIRALDYCPPFDITFGEYLRAIITADYELVKEDVYHYRVAIIEAFRRQGIYPHNIRTLSEESLLWRSSDSIDPRIFAMLRPYFETLQGEISAWGLSPSREKVFDGEKNQRKVLHNEISKLLRINGKLSKEMQLERRKLFQVFGLDPEVGKGKFEVHSLRPTQRIGPNGEHRIDLVAEITQRRPVLIRDGKYYLPVTWTKAQAREAVSWFRGGCTLIIDMESHPEQFIRYIVRKKITSEKGAKWLHKTPRFRQQLEFQKNQSANSLREMYLGNGFGSRDEPFAVLHSDDAEVYLDV